MILFYCLKGPFTLAIFAAISRAISWRFQIARVNYRRGIASSQLHGRFEITVKSPRNRSKNRQCKRALKFEREQLKP